MKKIRKKTICTMLSLLLAVALTAASGPLSASAAAGSANETGMIRINLNGRYISDEAEPIIENGTTLVPVRVIAEELGAEVDWNNQDRTIVIKDGAKQIQLSIGSKQASVSSSSGSNSALLEVAPFIQEENTMVPLRFIAEELGLTVNWDNAQRIISLTGSSDKEATGSTELNDYSISTNNSKEADLYLDTNSTARKPQLKVLGSNDPVFKGENQVQDPSLGEYRLEILFSDIRASAALQDKLGLETVKLSDDGLLQSIRLAYPPDDSAMVIYLGCQSYPRAELITNDNGFFIKLLSEDIQDGLKVSSKNIEDSDETFQLQLSIPQLEGLQDQQLQDSINKAFENQALQFQEETFKDLDEYVEAAEKQGWPIRAYNAMTSYRVTYSKNDLLSLYVDYYSYTGGAHGFTNRVSSNIDLKTGKELQLKDLFKAGVDYQKILNQEIKRQMQLEPDKYFPETLTQWPGISENQSCYIEDGNLVVYFSLYELAPYAAGIPQFEIPLASLELNL